ncbi:MAG: hypothetical protein EOP48_17360 [Sphingobacteriales bacterium]|nr:MAG: hypothetical protein EOP48_17360 [Sphingobacteriales bacterium]
MGDVPHSGPPKVNVCPAGTTNETTPHGGPKSTLHTRLQGIELVIRTCAFAFVADTINAINNSETEKIKVFIVYKLFGW